MSKSVLRDPLYELVAILSPLALNLCGSSSKNFILEYINMFFLYMAKIKLLRLDLM